MIMRLVLLTIVAGYVITAVVALIDLHVKSKRHNKTGWALFIVLVPVIGVMAYELTKRRHRNSHR